MPYFNNLLIAFSQLANAALGGNPNEMLSARAYRQDVKWLVTVINFLFWDKSHCKTAFEFELRNEQLPEYENLCLPNKDN